MNAQSYKAIGLNNLRTLPLWNRLPAEIRDAVAVVGTVLPFRCNTYVVDELIEWPNVPDDPIFRLTFPHPDMLSRVEYFAVKSALERGSEAELTSHVQRIRLGLNPHPARQHTANVPKLDGEAIKGVQHKYRETVLYFPSAGQACHAFCQFCFRWPQFVGDPDLRISAESPEKLIDYLRQNKYINDVLITGGDPLLMRSSMIRRHVEPLLAHGLEHVENIRIGTKAVCFWPQRFTVERDADDLLRLFEKVVQAGKSLAIMLHCSHPRELSTSVAVSAINRIRGTGAIIRVQAPILRHINDEPEIWASLWRRAVNLGMSPYYMFVERDTGPRQYFQTPLVRCWEIARDAHAAVSGLARSARGPVMSADPGKVLIDGVVTISGQKLFALQLIQARNPACVRQPFFAHFNPEAMWFDDLDILQDTSQHLLEALVT